MVSNRVSFVFIFNDSVYLMQNQKLSRVIFDIVYVLILVLIRCVTLQRNFVMSGLKSKLLT